MAHWPPRAGQLGRGPLATFPLWGVSMAPGAALGKKTEALRNSSPGDAHARAHPELCGGSWTWIWVNLPFFAQLRRCLWPAGAVCPETRTCQWWGGRDGWSIRKTQSQELCREGATAGAHTEGQQLGKTLAWLDPPKTECEPSSAFHNRRAKT